MRSKIYLLILIIVSFIPLLDLFHPGLPITHDGQDHVVRIANFYQNLQEGNIIPRWGGNLNWGYGHPILMFLYPLCSYFASFFHLLGFSLVDSVKIVFGLGYIASGVFMYLWLKEFMKEEAAFMGGILYLFAPYRFVDLYVRGAIGEHVAFIFMPLVMYFILKICSQKNPLYLFCFSLAFSFLILSHNAISLMFLPLIILYIFYLWFFEKRKQNFLMKISLGVFFGFSLSAFFWVPALFEGKYTLREIVTKGEYAKHFASIIDFIYGKWSYGGSRQFTIQIGFIQLAFSILVLPYLYFFRKPTKKIMVLAAGFLLIIITSLLFMTSFSKPLWEAIRLLQNFQFPWRLMSIVVFSSAVIGAIFVKEIPDKYKNLITIILFCLTLFFNRNYWQAKGFLEEPASFYTGIYEGTTDTGESAPIWSVRFMEKRPKAEIEVIEGAAKIDKISRTSTSRYYQINASEKTRIRENTLYFPGWVVKINGIVNAQVEYQDELNRGLITFFVEKGKNDVVIKFEETKLRLFSDLISLATIGIIVFVSIRYLIWKHIP